MLQRASLDLEARRRGEHLFHAAPSHTRFSASGKESHHSDIVGRNFSFNDALKLWIAEKRPRERTVYEWRRTMGELSKFIGHEDAHRLTVDDVIRWKSALLEANLATKTIKDAKLAVVRAIFQVAVDNRKLRQNPAEKVTITVKKVLAEAHRDFTDAEAVTVLKAARFCAGCLGFVFTQVLGFRKRVSCAAKTLNSVKAFGRCDLQRKPAR